LWNPIVGPSYEQEEETTAELDFSHTGSGFGATMADSVAYFA
jgi:hypothetical protein